MACTVDSSNMKLVGIGLVVITAIVSVLIPIAMMVIMFGFPVLYGVVIFSISISGFALLSLLFFSEMSEEEFESPDPDEVLDENQTADEL